ncbi:hypothetical protein ABB37_09527 [Leptomonas pyrrhocoris]|uniref:Cyclic nucleotide-binding domain-containing protein n=1 Tax=Leptomonas pyrrhocoris TaxID=157538 RepID=A0A0N0VCW2_LEPPY|nr:hypothetical protein ABB37_09527 [Leptomonas pyrrhocoris]XP_015652372.1 hypothetical protein ABB37_09527 [Leptomonas pyrrhocoris]XP_015652373.1 hypothetical protein ABB37_09527 [Leptomonas pyrrhocoris]KPA73932.1 hypothetical protein ABB37_09527 [Leptomonas pyrrhocoris]KPA73933.1 hypothetical protein ABB37_09527 [Leptomonas pyrrhocoris]KPA73934.1 hypothetical protein ABB37_09527 [Leptomonas pyrrhocoris]|eukprot:XP_015652371.1 hypothetical protein ABB37_09527 [Leptomonas pyrrhocoris]
MGMCCCKPSPAAERSPVAERSPADRLAGRFNVSPRFRNPFSVEPPLLSSVPNDGSDIDAPAAIKSADTDSSGNDNATAGRHGASDTRVFLPRRRGAVCGEALSCYLKDVKWWGSAKDPHSDTPDARQSELDTVRHVLLTHSLFTDCRDDAELMEEMLHAFERQETAPGEVIAFPLEVTAFHVVVQGRAVAGLTQTKADETSSLNADNLSRPLQGSCPATEAMHESGNNDAPRDRVGDRTQWNVGEAFGSEGLLYPLSSRYNDSSVHAASASEDGNADASASTSNTVTWRLSRVRYQQLLRLHYDEQLRRILRALSQCPLLQHLTPVQLFDLAEKAEVVTRGAAVPLLCAGEAPKDLLVLMSGTVAVEHERANGHGGQARIQAAILSVSDCVGDEEWLAGCAASSSAHPCAAAATYTYTTQQPIEAVRLSLQALMDLLSPADLAALQHNSRNVREKDRREEQVRESVRALVEQSLLARLSDDTDIEDTAEEAEDGSYERKKPAAGPAKFIGSAAFPNGRQLAQEPVMDDVTVKGADVTNFLLSNFFTRPTYCHADGRERGLSMAAFTAKRSYPRGAVLFEVAYEPHGDTTGASHSPKLVAHSPAKADHLYVVASGAISVLDADSGACIFTAVRGNSLGEEGLLPPLHCFTAAPLHTRVVVTGDAGCEVYELSAKAFREFLRRPYVAGIRQFCGVFCSLPCAEYFPENYWRFLFHCTTEQEVVGGDPIGMQGAPCVYVALLLDGRVNAYRGGAERIPATRNGQRDTGDGQDEAVATFRRGDIVGGQEAMEGGALAAAYVCECRTRMLCVPASSFGGLFRPAMPYLQSLWSQDRYKALRQVQ